MNHIKKKFKSESQEQFEYEQNINKEIYRRNSEKIPNNFLINKKIFHESNDVTEIPEIYSRINNDINRQFRVQNDRYNN